MEPTLADIDRLTARLVERFRPDKVILFGSRATDAARPDSDVDLLVVLPFEGTPIAVMSAMLKQACLSMDHPFAIDVHPRHPLHLGATPDPVMHQALATGIVLYEAAASAGSRSSTSHNPRHFR